MKHVASVLVLLAACGGDDGGTPRRDAATNDGRVVDSTMLVDSMMFDAPPDAQAFVLAVTCDGSEVVTVATNGSFMFTYTPNDQTINVDDVVQFVMPNNHNVVPDSTTTTDPGLVVSFNETKCLQFTIAGTFGFKCMPHGFKGSFTVQ